MNLLILAPYADTAGLAIGLKRAFDAHGGDWHARAIRTRDSPWHYPADIQWDRKDRRQTRDVLRLWAATDRLLILEVPEAAAWGPKKPTVVWHLGTHYRKAPEAVSRACRRIHALEVADMHDLIRRAPHLGWLPDVIDPAPLAALQAEHYPHDGVIRIAHAPTDRTIKSTEAIVAAIGRLERRHEFEFDLIEGVPNAECLVRKARADIFIDELTLGYGLNALECWSMGIPVISGVADPVTRDMMKADFGGSLPFLCTDAEMLEACIEDLIVSERDRRHWSAAGLAQIARFHSPAAVVERTVRLLTST